MKSTRIALALALGLTAGAFVAQPALGEDPKPKKREGVAQSFERSLKQAGKDTKEGADKAADDVDKGVDKTREHLRGDGEGPANAISALNADVAELRKIADNLDTKGDADSAKAVREVASRIEAKVKRMQERFGRRMEGEAKEAREVKEETKTIEKKVEKAVDGTETKVEEVKEVKIETKSE